MRNRGKTVVAALLVFVAGTVAATPPAGKDTRPAEGVQCALDVVNSTYINANNILMFATNQGCLARDIDTLFGYGVGTFYPYQSIAAIEDGSLAMWVLHSAGLWLGGKVGGETRVAVAGYVSEYVPGPMSGGTFQTDRPEFRVYKLYTDSLESNPNGDYSDWPTDQGAPVDQQGHPLMRGDQMLWTVFNDADPSRHTADPGATLPLGIEVQQTMWASSLDGDDSVYVFGRADTAAYTGPTFGMVLVHGSDASAMTDHEYLVVFREVAVDSLVWLLIDATTGDTLLEDQTYPSDPDALPCVDGFSVEVCDVLEGVVGITEIADGSGPITPVDVMCATNSSDDWTVTMSGVCDFSQMAMPGEIGIYDWEIRFTSGGSQYYDFYTDQLQPDRAPFEVWNIGQGTPGDPSDDERLYFSFIDDDDNGAWSWGDRIYPIEVPYLEPAPTVASYTWPDDFRIGRIAFTDSSGVLTSPATGTIVRFETNKSFVYTAADTFSFTAPAPAAVVKSDAEANSIFLQYKLHNKGGNTIEDMYVSLWVDPDLGFDNNDLVGCDTLDDLFYCYNGEDIDGMFGAAPPATGFKILYGPLVPSPGDTAVFDGYQIPDHNNLPMSSFWSLFGSLDPQTAGESYTFMTGINGKTEEPWVYDGDTLTCQYSGDPVAGTGDLDIAPADRRMLASMGPFTFNPGDSQYVLIRISVGQGIDRLTSITALKEVLNSPFDIPTDVEDNVPANRPLTYTLSQNYPNPFNPSTAIEFTLPQQSDVKITVYNVIGQKVNTLLDEPRRAGTHRVLWDGTNQTGRQVSTGVYLYRIEAGDFTETKKMILLK